MAIAFDNAVTSVSTGTSITLTSYAVGASNPFLCVAVANWAAATDLVTGITFNGVAMTIDSTVSGIIENGNAPKGYYSVYTLVGQSGTHDIVISSSGAGIGAASGIWVASYTGVDQTNPINAHARTATVGVNVSTLAVAVVTTTDQCWVINGEGDGSGSGTSVNAPFTIRQSPQTYIRMADTNAPVSTGLTTATWNYPSSMSTIWAMAIAPSATAQVTAIITQLLTLGVG